MRIHLLATGVSGFLLITAAPVFGSATYTIQKDTRFTQTSTAAPTIPDDFDFFATVAPNPIDTFDGGNVVGPGAFGTQTLTNNGGGNLQFFSGVVATQFPTGTYAFNVTDSVTPANNTSVSVDDSVEIFPNVIPALAAASFTALQSYDPTQPLTLNFNTFTPGAAPFNSSLVFLAILNLSTSSFSVFDGLQPNSGQDIIAANTLSAGVPYEYFLFFTNTLITGNGPIVTQVQLSDRTRGFFTTQGAVPEPSTMLLAISGIAVICWLKRRSTTERVTSGHTTSVQTARR
jgi:hypothetical protein